MTSNAVKQMMQNDVLKLFNWRQNVFKIISWELSRKRWNCTYEASSYLYFVSKQRCEECVLKFEYFSYFNKALKG